METGSEAASLKKRNFEGNAEGSKKPRSSSYENIKPTEASSASIDILNDDALLVIFSYLTINELIAIEKVSTKWKELSLMSWVNIKTINLPTDLGSKISGMELWQVLKRGGEYVTHLNFNRPHTKDVTQIDFSKSHCLAYPPSSHIIHHINTYCKNLTHLKLYLSSRGYHTYNLNSLSNSIAGNLKSLEIRMDFGSNYDGGLTRLFKKAKNLEELTVFITEFKGLSLPYLTKNLKSLCIYFGPLIKEETLEAALRELSNIEHLGLVNIKNLPLGMKVYSDCYFNHKLMMISSVNLECVSNRLKSLNLSTNFSMARNYKNLTFSNLRILNLSEDLQVDDDVLCTFIKKCPKLEELDLHDCPAISDKSFRQLPKLKCLTSLNLGGTNITDEAILDLALNLENLKKVCCFSLSKATNTGLLQFIQFSSKLTNLRIGYSDQFTSEFFKIAEKHVQERSNKIYLTIQIYFSVEVRESDLGIEGELKRLQLKPKGSEGTRFKRCRIVRHPDEGEIKKFNENEPVWCSVGAGE